MHVDHFKTACVGSLGYGDTFGLPVRLSPLYLVCRECVDPHSGAVLVLDLLSGRLLAMDADQPVVGVNAHKAVRKS